LVQMAFCPTRKAIRGAFRFKKNSQLLVLLGAINEDESQEGAFYFLLKAEKLELVHNTLAKRKSCQDQ